MRSYKGWLTGGLGLGLQPGTPGPGARGGTYWRAFSHVLLSGQSQLFLSTPLTLFSSLFTSERASVARGDPWHAYDGAVRLAAQASLRLNWPLDANSVGYSGLSCQGGTVEQSSLLRPDT